MITTIMVVLWPLTIVSYVIYNLFNKNKKLEDKIIKQANFIESMLSTIKEIDKAVEKIDATIWVQSDPELLSLFESVKEIQSKIKDYLSNG
jgi:molecular chaperone GrpE (heat shock protein)